MCGIRIGSGGPLKAGLAEGGGNPNAATTNVPAGRPPTRYSPRSSVSVLPTLKNRSRPSRMIARPTSTLALTSGSPSSSMTRPEIAAPRSSANCTPSTIAPGVTTMLMLRSQKVRAPNVASTQPDFHAAIA